MSEDPATPKLQFRLNELLGLMLVASALFAVAAYGYPLAASVLGLLLVGLWFRSTRLLVIVGALAAAAVLLILDPLGSRPTGPAAPLVNSGCFTRLRQIATAMQSYHDTYGRLPPVQGVDDGGQPAHSWRVLILPFMDQEAVYDQYRFNEPWDGPHNRQLTRRYASLFNCPDQSRPTGQTNYVAAVGDQTAWSENPSTDSHPQPMRDRILLVEISASGIPWTQPRDFTFEQWLAQADAPGDLLVRHNGIHIVRGDGTIHSLPPQSSADDLRKLIFQDGEQ